MKKLIGVFLIISVVGATVWRVTTHEEPMHAEDYLQLGIEQGASGKHEEAIEAFKKALLENPNYVPAYLSLGNAYGNTGRYEESIASYKEGIQLNPRHPEVPQMEMNIAWIAHKTKDSKTAILYSKKAIQSFTDRNDYSGVAIAATRLRLIENKPESP
ncbi:MAG: tetratricopeptide repeat protein [Nitrospina sp.]|jgi:tetratricopeptide (TPR) repeat protein|nr:tetratricopeptide repeat protein [Nitrospina sp.]MBT6716670.1 tetratricopeptide repeat protein [Nitrospina sp.]